MRQRLRGQRYESDEVVATLGGTSFVTRRGLVIEGNYRAGEKVLLVFDRGSRRYLPMYKKHAGDMPIVPLPPEFTARLSVTCEIELIDPPTVVRPMHWWPSGINWKSFETEGVDYIRTHYRVIKQCDPCGDMEWTPEPSQVLGVPPDNSLPFIYLKPNEVPPVPYFQGYSWTVPPIPPDPSNHCVQCWNGQCVGEILEFGQDDVGKYILWKAYTEYNMVAANAPQNFIRVGLGYVMLEPYFDLKDGRKVCATHAIIKVDCCQKTQNERDITMFWTALDNCSPYEPHWLYGSSVICELPECEGLPYDYCLALPVLVWYAWLYSGTFWLPPEKTGACLPYTWDFESSIGAAGGDLQPRNWVWAGYTMPPDWFTGMDFCFDIDISVTDRCGSKKTLHADCCNLWAPFNPMGMSYTSLSMTFNQEQNLFAHGGCPRYSWSLQGEGTLEVLAWPDRRQAVYTAPSQNANCSQNPMITATDCCGNEVSIIINISHTSVGAALEMCEYAFEDCYWSPTLFTYSGNVWTRKRTWDCTGTLLTDEYYECGGGCGGSCHGPYGSPSWQPRAISDCNTFLETGCAYCGVHCSGGVGGCWNQLEDLRTTEDKELGCCPLNPFTGLPM